MKLGMKIKIAESVSGIGVAVVAVSGKRYSDTTARTK